MASLQSEPGSQKPHYQSDDQLVKRTWRSFFRFSVLVVTITSLALSIITLIGVNRISTAKQISNAFAAIQANILSSIPDIRPINSLLNQLVYTSSVTLPLRISSLESNVLAAIQEACTYRDSQSSCSATMSVMNDQRYIEGIQVYSGSFLDLQKHTLSPPIAFPSFIPTSTTTVGCTRIPSFSLTKTHWCYTHNYIKTGCRDATQSNQYIALGTIYTDPDGTPGFSTSRSQYLNDGVNRKSCSISAVPMGCALYCFISVKEEVDYYKGTVPPAQTLILFFFNGTVHEHRIVPSSMNSEWVMLSPGVGSGVFYNNYIIFPLYGGMTKDKAEKRGELTRFFTPKNSRSLCKMNDSVFSNAAQSAYYPPYFSSRWIRSGLLACNWNQIITTNCEILTFSNQVMMMGAEGRLILINDDLFYYQRSTSWWPRPLVYKLDIELNYPDSHIQRVDQVEVTFPTRPGWGGCVGNNFCPMICVSGVYQDVWPVTNPVNTTDSRTLWVGGTLLSNTTRENPASVVTSGGSISQTVSWFNQTVPGAYSTTTCFNDQVQGRIFCLIIFEVGGGLLGEYQIVPFLKELKYQGAVHA
ncbi:attachment protein [Orthorubulavirus mapueraense]|uniref:Attachment protein n=1 Tax=Orthorubulavirus mapueraense TaxID=3052559 RepID=A5H727_9MONO|nr:attachment protein [Orthorubulavirus mapueraense]ABQ23937.1 attachment protein [Orthorubulavirus mapueraense]